MSNYMYDVYMLCKTNSIHDKQFKTNTNLEPMLLKISMTSGEYRTYLASLALQGHKLENIMVHSPESGNIYFFVAYEQYGYTDVETDFERREKAGFKLTHLPATIKEWIELFYPTPVLKPVSTAIDVTSDDLPF